MLPTAVRLRRLELEAPGRISLTRTVPAAVPSLAAQAHDLSAQDFGRMDDPALAAVWLGHATVLAEFANFTPAAPGRRLPVAAAGSAATPPISSRRRSGQR